MEIMINLSEMSLC